MTATARPEGERLLENRVTVPVRLREPYTEQTRLNLRRRSLRHEATDCATPNARAENDSRLTFNRP
jgi:hypothetical protein